MTFYGIMGRPAITYAYYVAFLWCTGEVLLLPLRFLRPLDEPVPPGDLACDS